MFDSNIEGILKSAVSGDEELEKLSDHFHSIESEIDGMANKPKAELDEILERAKLLTERTLGKTFVSKNWNEIEKEIEHNLRKLKEK